MEEKIAIIGAGVIGSAIACALAREGRRVTLFDRAEPGVGGASFGNAGHIAAELVQPLPSRELLFGFWRELFAFDGPLDIPLRRLGTMAPWAWRFACAAFRRERNTRQLAPLVQPAAAAFERMLSELGRLDLMRRHGHLQIWFGEQAQRQADAEAAAMQRLGIPTAATARDTLDAIATEAGAELIAGLSFPESGHVLDPLEVVRAFAHGAIAAGAEFVQADVRALRSAGNRIALALESGDVQFDTAVVCAGPWSAPLLAPFGLRAPLEAAYGYHVELAGQKALADAPIVYIDTKILVTPMLGRLRASSYMEFAGSDSSPDPRKPAALRRKLAALGYRSDQGETSWRGGRPVLPDYLPGIGRAPGPQRLFYAIGHQHIGLTLAPVTAELVADLVAERTPRHDLRAFDLQRFGKITSRQV
jgi:D-amino-acid dehydrogenase